MKKLCILLLLILSALLISCGGSKDSGEHYIEKTIQIPDEIEHISDIAELESGALRIAGSNGPSRKGWIWESKDEGANWQKVYCYTDIINADEKKEGECHAYIKEKETICVDIEYEYAEDIIFKTKCYFIDENGSCTEIENNSEGISYCDDKYKGLGYVSNIVNDDILLLTNEGNEVFIVNKEAGNSMKNILTKGEKLISKKEFVIKEDKIFLITTLGAREYDIKTGEVYNTKNKDFKKAADEFDKSQEIGIMAADENAIYTANKNGVLKYVDGDKLKIADNKISQFTFADVYLEKLQPLENEDILLALNRPEDKPLLVRYCKTVEKEKEKNNNIKVYTLEKDDNIEKFVKKFINENNDIDVEIQIGNKDESSNTDDVIKKLNTEILGGNGPDVIFFDGIDVEKYIKNGMLSNLKDIEGITGGSFFEKIQSIYADGSSIYAMPTRFYLPITISKYDEIINQESLDDFIDEIKVKDAKISEYTLKEVGLYCYQVFLNELCKNNNIDVELLKSYLENMKVLCNMYDKNEMFLSYCTLPPHDAGGIFSIMSKETDTAIDYINSPKAVSYLEHLDNAKISVAGKEKDLLFVPRYIVGVNAKSRDIESSKRFVEFLCSNSCQLINGNQVGLPIRKDTLKEALEGLKEDTLVMGGKNGDKIFKLKRPSDKQIQEILTLSENASVSTNNNAVVMKIVMEYTDKYICGDIDLNEALENITDRLSLYLSE